MLRFVVADHGVEIPLLPIVFGLKNRLTNRDNLERSATGMFGMPQGVIGRSLKAIQC